MAWIVKIPPSPRHRHIRWQVRYQDGPHERSAGIYRTRPDAVAVKHAIERREPPPTGQEPEPDRATTLFGAYTTQVWWPAWSPTRPRSTRTVKTKVNARIGDLRHTHAIWLLAQRVPLWAIAKRLGHANPVVTTRMYHDVAALIEDGHLIPGQLGLTPPPTK